MLFIVIMLQPQVSLRAHSLDRVRKPMPVPSQRLALIGGAVLIAAVVAIGSLMAAPDQGTMLKGFGFAIATLSLVPLTGYSGQISLSQLTFTGIGAVVMATWGASGNLLWVLVAVAVCAVVGALIALPAMRLSGIYLALATAAFGLFCYWMVFQQQDVMSGGTANVPRTTIGPIEVTTSYGQLIVLAVAFAVMANILVVLRRSSWGRRLSAMRDSPVACATLGLNLLSTKVGVFALSAAIAGAGGALAGRTFVVDEFGLDQSLPITMLAVVGGIGSVGGALLGGLLLGAQPLATTVLAANAIGIFGFASASVTQILSVMPGFMGISLGRNPDGAASEIGEAYRDFYAFHPGDRGRRGRCWHSLVLRKNRHHRELGLLRRNGGPRLRCTASAAGAAAPAGNPPRRSHGADRHLVGRGTRRYSFDPLGGDHDLKRIPTDSRVDLDRTGGGHLDRNTRGESLATAVRVRPLAG